MEYETKLHWKVFVTLSGVLTLFIYPLILRSTSEFVITNMRVILKTGWISRKTFEMNLNKIETVNVDQSVWGDCLVSGRLPLSVPVEVVMKPKISANRWNSGRNSRRSLLSRHLNCNLSLYLLDHRESP